MKLEYKILWIENEEEFVDSVLPSVQEILTDRGFEPIITKVVDESQIDNYLVTNYDLIISDFQLNDDENGKNGAEVIYDLRNEKKLDTEILFYSDKVNLLEDDTIRNKLAFMERINIQQGRATLLDKIEKVVELTLRKLLELNATRGLITAATSDLDVEIEEIVMLLVTKHNKSDQDLRQIVTDKVYTPLEKKFNNFWNTYDNFHNYFHKIDAVKKWEIFRDLLKPLKAQKEIKNFLDSNKTYQKQVIKIRNQFAHAKAIEDNGTLKLKGQLEGEDFEFTEESCIEIRKNLIAHKHNIEILKQVLGNE